MSSQAAPSRPPLSLPTSTHLDPGTYVRGSHAITLGEHALIHPRAHLVSVHGPVSLGDGCVVAEKAVIGGPVPSGSTSTGAASAAETGASAADDADGSDDPVKTTIGANVAVHAAAQIHAGATVGDGALIESHVVVPARVTVGAHSKVCAGVVLQRDVPEWCVVMGSGEERRRRKPGGEMDAAVEVTEKLRLKALEREREATAGILRHHARVASAMRKK